VSGVIPIRVTLTSDLQREKPYVSFFVDKEFKSLKNFPPYDYNWDTTKVPNGWHVLEAMTATPDAATPTKARSIHVNVNNPGGQTAKLNAIEDLNPKSKSAQVSGHPADLTSLAPSAKSDTGTGAAITSSRSPILQIVIPNGVAVPKTAKHPIGFTNAKSSEPSIYNGGGVAAASGTIPVSVNSGRISGPGPKRMGSAIQEPKGRMPKLAGRKATLPLVSDSGVVVPVIPPTNEVGGSLTRFEPGTTLESIARRTGHSADELRSLNGLKKGQALPKVGAIIVPRAGTFDVAFDGNQIAFDVPPRVEGGIKLAPFRQIFEHSGGRLYWFNSVKTVRAVNSSREIELKIGNPNALVNNQTMTMERKPFIETGRTIVPLTFIRDALNVNISYDEKSGRLLIESNK
jgi:hypothetical protein